MATTITDTVEITLEAPSIVIRDGAGAQRLTLNAAKQSSTGDVHTVAAGSVTGVFVNTTFDGSSGSTAYTIGDIVKALKALGFLAA